MKKDHENVFLKVDKVEPVFKNETFCNGVTCLDGIRVWIGSYGYFFPCDKFTYCDPDVVREDGRRQIIELANVLAYMRHDEKAKLFGYYVVTDIVSHFSYDEIKEKLDSWKKEKETIRVRDEVYNQSMQVRFVVTKIFVPSKGEDAIVNGFKKDGTAVKGLLLCNCKKTGLHVDDLDSYLEV